MKVIIGEIIGDFKKSIDGFWLKWICIKIFVLCLYLCIGLYCYNLLVGIYLRLRLWVSSLSFLAWDSELNFSFLVVCTSYIHSLVISLAFYSSSYFPNQTIWSEAVRVLWAVSFKLGVSDTTILLSIVHPRLPWLYALWVSRISLDSSRLVRISGTEDCWYLILGFNLYLQF